MSKTGSVFYSVLTETPQTVEEIAHRLLDIFVGVTASEIEDDVIAFFQALAEDGFVGCDVYSVSRTSYFSYSDRVPKAVCEEVYQNESEVKFFEEWGHNYHLSRVTYSGRYPFSIPVIPVHFFVSKDRYLLRS